MRTQRNRRRGVENARTILSSMNKWQIILAPVVFLAGCQSWWPQQVAPAAPPAAAVPYPVTTVAPVVVEPPFVEGPPMLQPAMPAVPIYPPQSTIVPLPSQTPGSIFGPPAGAPVTLQPVPSPPGSSP